MSGHTIKITTLFLVSLFLFSACGFDSIYNESVNIEEAKWYKDEAVHFDIEITDSINNYDFILNLRNTTDYRYSNLYIFLTTRFPNGNMTRDTIECILADIDGRWLGKGWSNIKENNILLKQGLRFPITGNYEFFVQQAMRVEPLEGIHDVGLQISNSDN